MSPYKKIVEGLRRIFLPPNPPLASEAAPDAMPTAPAAKRTLPKRIPRADHTVSRQNISRNALRVLYKLKDAGFAAYLVGGGVRDMLLGMKPKDFDVVTDARPEEIKTVFRNCRLIGRRFRLAHVHFGNEIIEVATFRGGGGDGEQEQTVAHNGLILRDNVYGTFEQDAWRRDFTINSLYYDILDYSLVDCTHQGVEDLNNRVLRLIGDPWVRYREDPVRMLRAVRFCAKLNFTMHPSTEEPIREMAGLLREIPSSRLYEEVLKLFLSGHSLASYRQLQHYGLFAQLFPQWAVNAGPDRFLEAVLADNDERLANGKALSHAFLFSAIFWRPMCQMTVECQQKQDESPQECLHRASHQIFREEQGAVGIPKRLTVFVREIWQLQYRMEKANSARALKLLKHPRFFAALDFALLRAQADSALQDWAGWWSCLADAEELDKPSILSAGLPAFPTVANPESTLEKDKKVPSPRRRRRGKRPKPIAENVSAMDSSQA